MTDVIVPPYDNDINYLDLAIQYERLADPKINTDLFYYIDGRLGNTKKSTTDDAQTIIETGLDLNDNARNRHWYKWVSAIIAKRHKRKTVSIKQMTEQVIRLNSKSTDLIYAFITLNFDDERISMGDYNKHICNLKQICKSVAALTYQQGAIKRITYVMEKYRTTGIHHHCHFLFEFNEKVPPSDMINKVYGASGVKKYAREKNYVEYLGPQKLKKEHNTFEGYYKYIRGDKRAEKLPCVEKDIQWRNEHKIEHLYTVEY